MSPKSQRGNIDLKPSEFAIEDHSEPPQLGESSPGAQPGSAPPPPEDAPAADPPREMAAEALAPLVQTAFGVTSLFAGEHWQVTDAEAMLVAQPLARIVSRMPVVQELDPGTWDLVDLVTAAGGLVAARIMEGQRLAAERRQKHSPAASAQPDPTNPENNPLWRGGGDIDAAQGSAGEAGVPAP